MIPWHQYVFALIFILAGLNHFRSPKLYERIIPSYIPAGKTMVYLSGILEIALGILLLVPKTQSLAAWGIIVLMVLFLPVHVYMVQNKKAILKMPKWALILRLPLQFVLIYWAYLYV